MIDMRRAFSSICCSLHTWSMEAQLICIHWFIHSYTKYSNERAVVFHVIDSGVHSCWNIFMRNLLMQVWRVTLYKSHGFLLIIISVVIIDMSVSTKRIKEKDFVMFWPWWRMEAEANRAVNNISETFSTMRLGVQVRNLHVFSCFYHFKCISSMNLV